MRFTEVNLFGVSVALSLVPTVVQLATPFGSRPTGLGNASLQGTRVLASLVRREAYVLADFDAFWLIAWVSAAGILRVLLLHRPPPNPMTPPRSM